MPVRLYLLSNMSLLNHKTVNNPIWRTLEILRQSCSSTDIDVLRAARIHNFFQEKEKKTLFCFLSEILNQKTSHGEKGNCPAWHIALNALRILTPCMGCEKPETAKAKERQECSSSELLCKIGEICRSNEMPARSCGMHLWMCFPFQFVTNHSISDAIRNTADTFLLLMTRISGPSTTPRYSSRAVRR